MLRQLGVDVKVQQELLRHADVRTTMNVYTQAVSEQKRAAHSSVVRMVLAWEKRAEMSQLDICGHGRGGDVCKVHRTHRYETDKFCIKHGVA